jgi:hypothetical protein
MRTICIVQLQAEGNEEEETGLFSEIKILDFYIPLLI